MTIDEMERLVAAHNEIERQVTVSQQGMSRILHKMDDWDDTSQFRLCFRTSAEGNLAYLVPVDKIDEFYK